MSRPAMVMFCRLPVLLAVWAAAVAEGRPARGADAIGQTIRATLKVANKSSTATGFLISRPSRAHPDRRDLILVTAAHVFQKMSGEECRVVLRQRQSDGTYRRKEVPIQVRSGNQPRWFKHPQADVAALPVQLPGAAAPALPVERIADESMIRAGSLKTGDEVWIACYPARLEATAPGFPVLRRGTVASFPLTPVASYKTFLVDVSTFNGDSGAPVMVRQRAGTADLSTGQSEPLIAGLVVGQQRQTDKAVMPYQELTVHHPLGLAIVVQGELIRQTIQRVPP